MKKWYEPQWISEYIEHNNYFKVLLSVMLVSTVVGAVCWLLFFRGLFLIAISLYFCITMWGIHFFYLLSEEKRNMNNIDCSYGCNPIKTLFLVIMLIGSAFFSSYVMLGVNLLLGGDFP